MLEQLLGRVPPEQAAWLAGNWTEVRAVMLIVLSLYLLAFGLFLEWYLGGDD